MVEIDDHTFEIDRERAIDYLNTCDPVYVFDSFAGVGPILPHVRFHLVSAL